MINKFLSFSYFTFDHFLICFDFCLNVCVNFFDVVFIIINIITLMNTCVIEQCNELFLVNSNLIVCCTVKRLLVKRKLLMKR